MDKFYNEDFEKYLREQTDQFKMQPSKKTWHGIYNNFHPGRRWPSVATGLMIILLLTLTNTLNTRQQAELLEAYKNSGNSSALITKSGEPQSKKLTRADTHEDLWEKNLINDLFAITNTENNSSVQPNENTSLSNASTQRNNNQLALKANGGTATNKSEINQEKNIVENNIPVHSADNISDENLSSEIKDGGKFDRLLITDILKPETVPNKTANTLSLNKNQSISGLIKKFKRSRANWSFYVTPAVNFRKISNNINSVIEMPGGTSYVAGNNDVNKSPSHHAAPGIEVGTNVSFRIVKRLQFFTGFQLNYSGYNITASNSHPVLSSLVIVQNGNAQSQQAISYYSTDDNGSMVTLHNYNVEAGIPLGLKYKFLDTRRFYVNLLSSLIPTANILQRSYLLSADSHNYVSYPDLQRNFNVNSEIGAFIGFKVSKLKYEVGPDFRYQVLSNFKKSAPYSEHLVNYGIRFTISN